MCEGCDCTCGNKPWLWIECGYHQAVKADHPAVLREAKRRNAKALRKIAYEAAMRKKLGWSLSTTQEKVLAERDPAEEKE